MTLLPKEFYIKVFTGRFAAAQSADPNLKILEPLMSLIVDRSAAPNVRWSPFFSTMPETGLIDYLTTATGTPLPDLRRPDHHAIHETKRDAVIGIIRVFEQMLAGDTRHVRRKILETLERALAISGGEIKAYAHPWGALLT